MDIPVEFDYSSLRGAIVKNYGTQKSFAHAMNMSERTLSLKLNNHIFFNQEEMIKATKLLNGQNADLREFFLHKKFKKLNKTQPNQTIPREEVSEDGQPVPQDFKEI